MAAPRRDSLRRTVSSSVDSRSVITRASGWTQRLVIPVTKAEMESHGRTPRSPITPVGPMEVRVYGTKVFGRGEPVRGGEWRPGHAGQNCAGPSCEGLAWYGLGGLSVAGITALVSRWSGARCRHHKRGRGKLWVDDQDWTATTPSVNYLSMTEGGN
ncbi:hypothetical protein B0T16DRAFT_390640 [Cercophora newfieldiana]|uniref:Uncharacterized protein n=1 Tax=Cercophora newfieldiana TaxID=92897 RepID=A0AA39Y513_9PEZI|nr:hypothetical protein B0T16DRAFT_390640 [Cercophora newfieldiana]